MNNLNNRLDYSYETDSISSMKSSFMKINRDDSNY